MGDNRKVYKVLVGKPEGWRPLGRPSCRWEAGIRMKLMETGWGCVEEIQLAQDRERWRTLVNAVMNYRVPGPRNYLSTELELQLNKILLGKHQ
jgi:hypothetical protein